jgi:hypothetical protein
MQSSNLAKVVTFEEFCELVTAEEGVEFRRIQRRHAITTHGSRRRSNGWLRGDGFLRKGTLDAEEHEQGRVATQDGNGDWKWK